MFPWPGRGVDGGGGGGRDDRGMDIGPVPGTPRGNDGSQPPRPTPPRPIEPNPNPGGVVVGPDPGPSTHPDVPDPDVFPTQPGADGPPNPFGGANNPITGEPVGPVAPMPPALWETMRGAGNDGLEWEMHEDGSILVFPEDSDSAVWGYWPPEFGPGGDLERHGEWETLDPGDYPRGPDQRPWTPPPPVPGHPPHWPGDRGNHPPLVPRSMNLVDGLDKWWLDGELQARGPLPPRPIPLPGNEPFPLPGTRRSPFPYPIPPDIQRERRRVLPGDRERIGIPRNPNLPDPFEAIPYPFPVEVPPVWIPEPVIVFPDSPLPSPGVPPEPSIAPPMPDIGVPSPQPSMPTPTAPPAPVPQRTGTPPLPSTRPAWWERLAPMLPSILRRRGLARPDVVEIFRDRFGEPVPSPPPPYFPDEPIGNPFTPGTTPGAIPGANPLTFVQPAALGFQSKQPDDECNCDETEEEKEANRRPSNTVANVKPYRRRMSQNSLDNLREGFK